MRTVVRWNDFDNLVNRMMNDTVRPTFRNEWANHPHRLPLDIFESDQAYLLQVEVPGLNPDAIQIRLDKEELLIEANLEDTIVDENTRAVLRERRSGQFQRRIRLNTPIDQENIVATYENGLLTLTLPKVPEAQPKVIAVKVAH